MRRRRNLPRSLPPARCWRRDDQVLKSLPKTHAGDGSACARRVSALAAFDPDTGKFDHEANLRKSVRLISRLTSVTTAGWRIQAGAGAGHRCQWTTGIAIFVRADREKAGGLAGARAGYDLQFVCRA